MAGESKRDRIVAEVVEKIRRRRAPDVDEEFVRAKAEEAVDELLGAPVQTYTPLLAENAVLNQLPRQRREPDASRVGTVR